MTEYLAYGSNMDADRMNERRVGFSQRRHAILRRWRLAFNKKPKNLPSVEEGYANIVRDENGTVEGILYDLQDDTALAKLDCYEGYPDHYDRTSVNVQLDDGRTIQAITYVAQPWQVQEGLKPNTQYLGHLLRGYDLLSEAYCQKLKAWPTCDRH